MIEGRSLCGIASLCQETVMPLNPSERCFLLMVTFQHGGSCGEMPEWGLAWLLCCVQPASLALLPPAFPQGSLALFTGRSASC